MKKLIFTICAKNYLSRARALLDSCRRHEPDVDLVLVLSDRNDGHLDDFDFDFEIVTAEELGIEDFEDLAIRYDITELSTAIKPASFLHLLERGTYDAIVYLDPDTWLVSPLEELWERLGSGAEAVLTPHTTVPIEDGDKPDDGSMLQVGVYNLGFLAIRDAAQSRDFMAWWHRRLLRDCRIDLPEGLFVDQKWADMLPCLVERTSILHHPGYNVAYWNLMNRDVQATTDAPGWSVNGEALRFLHLSGLDVGPSNTFSKHQTRFTMQNLGPLRTLVERYREAVQANDHERHGSMPYAFETLDDGTPLPEVLRRTYRDDLGELPAAGRREALVDHCNARATRNPGSAFVPITRLMERVWDARPDLQDAFDLRDEAGARGFAAWWAHSASRELGLTDEFVPDAPSEAAAESPPGDPRPVVPNGPTRRPLRARLALALLRNAHRTRSFYMRLPIPWRARIKRTLMRVGYQPATNASPVPALRDGVTAPAKSADPGAQLIGYPRAELGMGEHVRLSAAALGAVHFPFSIYDFSANVVARQQDDRFDEFLSTDAPFPVNIFHINADQMPVAHDALGSEFFSSKYNIGFWAWELSRFPDAWLPSIDLVDEIWAPSRFIQESIAAKTDKPVVWMPLAVDVQPLPSLDRNYFHLPKDKFVFFFSFDFASFAARKNPWAVLDAFEQAFAPGDDRVHLVVKTMHLADHAEQVEALQMRLARDPRIRLIPEVLSHREIAGLTNQIDCYVSLHRSEGFGRGMAEAMHLGKPVIATGYSGNTDFMDEESACLVDYEMIPVEENQYPFHEGQEWADPSVEQAAAYMRRLVDEPAYGRRLGRRARRLLTSEFSPVAVGRRMHDRLAELGMA